MKTPRKLLFASLILAFGGSAFLLLHHRNVTPPVARPVQLRCDWPRGTSYRYALAWRGETGVDILDGGRGAGTPLEGRIDLAAELELRSYGPLTPGAPLTLLGARIERPSRHQLKMLGRDLLPTDALAAEVFQRDGKAREALFVADASGAIRGFYFAKDDPALWKHFATAIITGAEIRLDSSASKSWNVTQSTLLGHGPAHYELTATDPPSLARTRLPYEAIDALPGRTFATGEQTVTGSALATLAAAGHLVGLKDDEEVMVRRGGAIEFHATTHFALSLIEIGHFDPPPAVDLAALEAHQPGEVVADGGGQKLLEQRVAGLTPEEMERGLLDFAASGSLPDPSAWLIRASGLLKLHPELCAGLVKLFDHPVMSNRGRARILDLLAGTGTPSAQEAMRQALSLSSVHKNPALLHALRDRFALVPHPTPETLSFVDREFAHATGHDRMSAAYVLGAAAGNALKAGDGEARAYSDELRGALGRADIPEERRHLVAALGNVGAEENVAEIVRCGHDDDESVRAAAAWALRKTDVPEARAALIGLTADATADVEERALEALGHVSMSGQDLTALSEVVANGRTQPEADGELLLFLSGHANGGAPVIAMLDGMLARNSGDLSMQARIRNVRNAVH